jgi:uncharacterized membrane protein YjgN (DUF898 family)
MSAAPTAGDSSAAPPSHDKVLPLEFRGNTREYFRIWAVNLCLTLLTFGIFSAWAKVRKKRYLYSNTVLDGTPFQYLGQPVPILKGRVIAATLFLVYYASSNIFTSLLPYILAAGLVLAPWVVARSAAFNARNSAYRNMTFSFDGNYVGALLTLYAWGLVPAIVVGMMFDWSQIEYLPGLVFAIFGLAFPWWLQRLKAFIIGNTVFGGERGELQATGTQFFKVYFLAGLIMSAAAGVAGGIAAMVVLGKGGPPTAVGIIMITAPAYLGYIFAFAYIKANTANLVWNNSPIGPIRFHSTLAGTGLANLYITNALAIIASAGLLVPWAVIRTFKYRADHMQVQALGPLTEFQGSTVTSVQASGAEVAELFDLDLSL